MKKGIFSVFVMITLVFSLLLTGCNQESSDGSRRIVPPVTQQLPIVGKWEVVKQLSNKQNKKGTEWIGKQMEFSKDKVLIGDYTLRSVGFKTRTVNADEYFLFNHKSFENELKMPTEQTNIVTVTELDKYYCEIVEIDDNSVILEINNYDLLVKKSTKSKIEQADLAAGKQTQLKMAYSLDSNINSGVLIGLRSKEKNNKVSQTAYNYRTMWIAADNQILHPIIQKNSIIFPRKSGFWEINVSRSLDTGGYKDVIEKHSIAVNLDNQAIQSLPEKSSLKMDVETRKVARNATSQAIEENAITYLGNDYISIENKQNTEEGIINKLKIVPIDSLPKIIPVKLSDLVTEGNVQLADNSNNVQLEQLKAKDYWIHDKGHLMENVGLVRKAGHWYFNGRISYYDKGSITDLTYRINLIPPPSLIFYDELYVKWTDIKEAVPDAMDAFTSPQKDIALILTKQNRLLIYAIRDQALAATPLTSIKLEKGESIVMAEWATGSYVQNWEDTLSAIK